MVGYYIQWSHTKHIPLLCKQNDSDQDHVLVLINNRYGGFHIPKKFTQWIKNYRTNPSDDPRYKCTYYDARFDAWSILAFMNCFHENLRLDKIPKDFYDSGFYEIYDDDGMEDIILQDRLMDYNIDNQRLKNDNVQLEQENMSLKNNYNQLKKEIQTFIKLYKEKLLLKQDNQQLTKELESKLLLL
jgi:hypothetical protein